jgi:type II/IV secretion system protein/type II secretion system (T2SS) protein E
VTTDVIGQTSAPIRTDAQKQTSEREAPATGLPAVASLHAHIQDLTRTLRSVLEGTGDDRSAAVPNVAQVSDPAPVANPASIASPPRPAEPAANPRRLGKYDYLVAQRFITREQLAAATTEARNRQMSTESVLMDKYSVRKPDIATALTLYYRHPFMSLDERFVLAPELIKGLSVQHLRNGAWIPIKREGDAVVVLVDDPHDLPKIDSIEKRFGSTKVQFAVGIRENILEALDAATNANSPRESVADILGDVKEEEYGKELPDLAGVEICENESTIIRLVNQIIVDAHRGRASDIHVEPCGPTRETSIRFRIDGTCVEYQTIPASLRNPLVARLKIMANLDIAERRKPQDGKIKIRRQEGGDLELRVATVPTVGANEDVVLRLLGTTGSLPIDRLLLSERNFRELKAIAKKPYGLILCVGPTGSGKTTTLHAVLGHINTSAPVRSRARFARERVAAELGPRPTRAEAPSF